MFNETATTENYTLSLRDALPFYKDQETWPQNALIGEDGYDSMRDILIDGGLVTGRHPYERLVRPEFARNAIDV